MDLTDLKSKIDERTRLLILCSPHNPVGRVWDRDELEALAEIILDNDLLLFRMKSMKSRSTGVIGICRSRLSRQKSLTGQLP